MSLAKSIHMYNCHHMVGFIDFILLFTEADFSFFVLFIFIYLFVFCSLLFGFIFIF